MLSPGTDVVAPAPGSSGHTRGARHQLQSRGGDNTGKKRGDPPYDQAMHSVMKLSGFAYVKRCPHAASNVSTEPVRRERHQSQV